MLPYQCYLEISPRFSGHKQGEILRLLKALKLDFDPRADLTAAIFDHQDKAVATASLQQNILKCIGISPDYRGEGLTGELFSALIPHCIKLGYQKQFLFTKPGNKHLFSPYGFTPLCETPLSVLMERPAGGLVRYLTSLPRPDRQGRIGAIVAHCNPLTNGHLYLMEQAASRCDYLYVFILSEDQGEVPASVRLRLVRSVLERWPHCCVCPTDQYMISQATFPSYFLRDQQTVQKEWCLMDAKMFAFSIAPALGITDRFVGTEPLSPVTAAYNQVLSEVLAQNHIRLTQIPRLTSDEEPISASRVRALLKEGRVRETESLVPEVTFRYLCGLAPSGPKGDTV